MGPMAVVASSVIVIPTFWHVSRLAAAIPIAATWMAGPVFAWWLSAPLPERTIEPLSAEERHALRRVARKTWRFFDTFVVAHGHNLAPDNYQEDPGGVVAWRTSPTNIGLQLLSYVSAYDLGYLTVADLEDRVSTTLVAMAGLERFRGHYFNWYNIDTLEPTRPMYVSTVDSGNLAGHLLVLRLALLEASESPLFGPQLLDGARDTALLALEDLVACQDALAPARSCAGASRVARWHHARHRHRRDAEQPRRVGGAAPAPQRSGGRDPAASRRARQRAPPTRVSSPVGAEYDGGLSVPVTPLEKLTASIDDVGRSIDGPLALLNKLAPWAALVADAPAATRDEPALKPLLRIRALARGARRRLEGSLSDSRIPGVAEFAVSRQRGRRGLGPRPGRQHGGLAARVRGAACAPAPLGEHRARDVGAHRLLGALRRSPQAVLHRLQPQRGSARRQLLRPAGQRMPPRELPGGREGRRAPGALVPPRPQPHQDPRGPHPGELERIDVRVPDAAAGHARLAGNPALRRRTTRSFRLRSDTERHAACRGA